MVPPTSRCYFLLHVDDLLTIGRKAREHYNRLTARYEMKDMMGILHLWCDIEFMFLRLDPHAPDRLPQTFRRALAQAPGAPNDHDATPLAHQRVSVSE